MVAPSGVCGVHCLPKAGHSLGFLRPCSTSPLMHSGNLVRRDGLHFREALLGVEAGELRAQAVARHGDDADAAPGPVGHLEDIADDGLGGLRCPHASPSGRRRC